MIEYDIVYRYCSPEESSGDGKKIRSRDNNELAHSIISLGLLTDKFQKIFIIHRGPPPAHCVQQSVEQVIFIQEKELLEKISHEYQIKVGSGNSEICKMGFQLIPDISPWFLVMDDDFLIRAPSSIDYFFRKGLLTYPKDGSHVPRLFCRKQYKKYIDSLTRQEKLAYSDSGQDRRDLFPPMIARFIRDGTAKRGRFWSGFLSDRGRGIVQILILMSFFSYVDLTQKKFVCVNDHWDFHPRFYKIQMAIFENWCRRSTWFRLLQLICVLSSLALLMGMPLLLALVPAFYVVSKITSVRQ